MTARIRLRDASGTLRTVARLRMRDAGGTLRTITRVRIRDQNNVLRVVYDPAGAYSLSVALSATSRYGITVGTGTAVSNSVTATPSGGTAPYTYAWACIAHDNAVVPTANSPTSATTTFTQTSIGVGEAYTSTFRVTVTDSATPANTATADVIANFADAS